LFKSLYLYSFTLPEGVTSISLVALSQAAEQHRFAPCLPSQDRSSGWTAPRNESRNEVISDLIEYVAGWMVLQTTAETKTVPSDVINRRVDEVVAQLEANEGRKPGRKELREIRDAVRDELLPHAFPKRTVCNTLIDLSGKRILIGASSQAMADRVVTLIVQTFDGISVSLVNCQSAPQAMMVQWLTDPDTLPDTFAVGRSVVLKASDESKASVKFDRHHLDVAQMREHIGQGKLPTQLDLEWRDRVSFTLTEGMQLKKIQLLDLALSDAGDDTGFDADVALLSGELGALLDDLVHAHGGPLA
jgi:recombination associated protein RdgC